MAMHACARMCTVFELSFLEIFAVLPGCCQECPVLQSFAAARLPEHKMFPDLGPPFEVPGVLAVQREPPGILRRMQRKAQLKGSSQGARSMQLELGTAVGCPVSGFHGLQDWSSVCQLLHGGSDPWRSMFWWLSEPWVHEPWVHSGYLWRGPRPGCGIQRHFLSILPLRKESILYCGIRNLACGTP